MTFRVYFILLAVVFLGTVACTAPSSGSDEAASTFASEFSDENTDDQASATEPELVNSSETAGQARTIECRVAAIDLRRVYASWRHPSYIFEMMPAFANTTLSTEYLPLLLELEKDLNQVSIPACASSAAMSVQSLLQLSRDLAEYWITNTELPDPISGVSDTYLSWIDEYARVADEQITLLNAASES